jgi:hypothetical protein
MKDKKFKGKNFIIKKKNNKKNFLILFNQKKQKIMKKTYLIF